MTSTKMRVTVKPPVAVMVYLLAIMTGVNVLTGVDCAMLAGLVAPIGMYSNCENAFSLFRFKSVGGQCDD